MPLANSSRAGHKTHACMFLKLCCQFLVCVRVCRGRSSELRDKTKCFFRKHLFYSLLKMLNIISRLKHWCIYEGDYHICVNVKGKTQRAKKFF